MAAKASLAMERPEMVLWNGTLWNGSEWISPSLLVLLEGKENEKLPLLQIASQALGQQE